MYSCHLGAVYNDIHEDTLESIYNSILSFLKYH